MFSSDDSSMKTIFVQVSLYSGIVYQNSSVCQIFLEGSCSQMWVLTCFSHNPASCSVWYFSWSSRSCFNFHCCWWLLFLNYIPNRGYWHLKTLCSLLIAFSCFVSVNYFQFQFSRQLLRTTHGADCWGKVRWVWAFKTFEINITWSFQTMIENNPWHCQVSAFQRGRCML